jgi:hypothetical protein
MSGVRLARVAAAAVIDQTSSATAPDAVLDSFATAAGTRDYRHEPDDELSATIEHESPCTRRRGEPKA